MLDCRCLQFLVIGSSALHKAAAIFLSGTRCRFGTLPCGAPRVLAALCRDEEVLKPLLKIFFEKFFILSQKNRFLWYNNASGDEKIIDIIPELEETR